MARESGDTFRKTLRALHHASTYDKSYVLFVFGSFSAKQHALVRALDTCQVLVPGYSSTDSKNYIRFGNDSIVRFAITDYVSQYKWSSLKVTLFVEDESVHDRWPPREYSYAAREASATAERNFSHIRDVSREID